MLTVTQSQTGPPAHDLLKLSNLFEAVRTRPVRMLESAAGGGCLTAALFRQVPPEEIKDLEVVCGDVVPEMVELAAARSRKEGWKNVDCRVFDGTVRCRRSAFLALRD
jgi:ubiquinone/menaquinone biosynthesis C-methylase UbiE